MCFFYMASIEYNEDMYNIILLVALHAPWDRGCSFYLWTEMCGSRVGLSCAIPAALCSLEKDCAVVLGP